MLLSFFPDLGMVLLLSINELLTVKHKCGTLKKNDNYEDT